MTWHDCCLTTASWWENTLEARLRRLLTRLGDERAQTFELAASGQYREAWIASMFKGTGSESSESTSGEEGTDCLGSASAFSRLISEPTPRRALLDAALGAAVGVAVDLPRFLEHPWRGELLAPARSVASGSPPVEATPAAKPAPRDPRAAEFIRLTEQIRLPEVTPSGIDPEHYRLARTVWNTRIPAGQPLYEMVEGAPLVIDQARREFADLGRYRPDEARRLLDLVEEHRRRVNDQYMPRLSKVWSDIGIAQGFKALWNEANPTPLRKGSAPAVHLAAWILSAAGVDGPTALLFLKAANASLLAAPMPQSELQFEESAAVGFSRDFGRFLSTWPGIRKRAPTGGGPARPHGGQHGPPLAVLGAVEWAVKEEQIEERRGVLQIPELLADGPALGNLELLGWTSQTGATTG